MKKSDKAEHAIFGLRSCQILIILFGVSFLFRFIYLSEFKSMPLFQNPIMDELYHLELVDQINSEEGLPDEPYFRAPLYPYFLSFIYKITGESIYLSRLIQIILGSLLPVLIWLLGRRLFNREIALMAAGITVFYPTLIYFDSALLITSIMVLLTTLLIWQLYRCQEKTNLKSFIFAGLLLGITALARPNILLFGPALFIWVWLILKPKVGIRRAILYYAVMGLTCLIVIIPVTVRNYVVSKEIVFISWQGGFNFFLGNNREANGWSAAAGGIDASWQGGYDEAIKIAEMELKRKLPRSEISDYWYGRAWEDIRSDMSSFIGRLIKKTRLLFNGFEIPNNQDMYLVRSFAPVMKPIMFDKGLYFPYGVLAPLALIGLALSLRRWRKYLLLYIFLGSYAMSLIAFFVCARFRQPLIPILILFASYAIYRVYKNIRKRNFKWLFMFIPILVLLMIETNHQVIDVSPERLSSAGHFVLGYTYNNQNKKAEALMEYKLAVEADPANAHALTNIGSIMQEQGHIEQAIAHYERAINANPRLYNPYVNLGSIYLARKEYPKACALLEYGCRMIPQNDLLYLELGMAYYRQNRFEDAKHVLEKCLQINPGNAEAQKVYHQVLGQL